MCNIRCASREKREDASPQKPQPFAKAQGDTHTPAHTHTYIKHMTHAHQDTKGTDSVVFNSSFKKMLMDWHLEKETEMWELCVNEALIWCRLTTNCCSSLIITTMRLHLLTLTQQHHNLIRKQHLWEGFTFLKAPKKAPDFPHVSQIYINFTNVYDPYALAAYASGGVPG